MRDKKEIKYADIVSGEENINFLVTLSGGARAGLGPCHMVLRNRSRSYPIINLMVDVAGVLYFSSLKDLMDSKSFVE